MEHASHDPLAPYRPGQPFTGEEMDLLAQLQQSGQFPGLSMSGYQPRLVAYGTQRKKSYQT